MNNFKKNLFKKIETRLGSDINFTYHCFSVLFDEANFEENKYEIALIVFEEYCNDVHGKFESPAERLAMGLWLMSRKNSGD